MNLFIEINTDTLYNIPIKRLDHIAEVVDSISGLRLDDPQWGDFNSPKLMLISKL